MNHKINTKKYQKIIDKVIIDSHELDRHEFAMEQYAPFKPTIEPLNTGDYIFIGHNGIKVAVEYKTGSDFLTSIDSSENHLHNQVYRMIHEYDYTLVIMECEDLQKLCTKRFYQTGLNTSVQEINGAISDLNTVSTVLFSQTMYGAFDLMMRSAGKLIEEKPFLWKFGKKETNTALNYLNCIHGLKNKANDIVTTLNLRTKKDLDNLTMEKLLRVDGIGEITAEMILNEIK